MINIPSGVSYQLALIVKTLEELGLKDPIQYLIYLATQESMGDKVTAKFYGRKDNKLEIVAETSLLRGQYVAVKIWSNILDWSMVEKDRLNSEIARALFKWRHNTAQNKMIDLEYIQNLPWESF